MSTKIEWCEESWKSLKNYLDYLISNRGRIRSLKNNKTDILKPINSQDNHLYVFLYDGHGNSDKIWVHRAVLIAFVGAPDSTQEGRHLDGNPQNNNLGNLEWGTRKQNMDDKRRHGRMPIPHMSKFTKLKPKDIPVIRSFQGEKNSRYVARIFNTSHTTILKIWLGKHWKGY